MVRAVEQSRTSGAEFPVVGPNGEIRWLVGRWRWIKDRSGQPIRLTGVNIDRSVTDEIESTTYYMKAKRRTRAIFESALDALITMDAEGRVQDWNPHQTDVAGQLDLPQPTTSPS